MLHTFRASDRFRARIEAALDELARAMSVGHFSTLDAGTLRLVEAGDQRPGSKPLLSLRDSEGRAYVFKHCDPALAAAEAAAFELRQLGGRPAVPARLVAIDIDLDGFGPIVGSLKPFVDFDAESELDVDTTQWSDEQRAVMVLEHAWEWFVDNMDTNTSQYALMGPLRLPLNIDWDRSFFSDGRSEFSRFEKYRATLPNARTFLYADYVAGKVQLPLWMLASEARRIRRLPRAEVTRILAHYAERRFSDPAERQRFVTRMTIRHRGIEREAANFIRELWAERRALVSAPGGLSDWAQHQSRLLWAEWQVVLNGMLRGPVGVGARRVLTKFRGWRGRRTAVLEGLPEIRPQRPPELEAPPSAH